MHRLRILLSLVKDSITVKLPDVYVTSERPLVTVTDDALSFDVPNLIMAKPVNTHLIF